MNSSPSSVFPLFDVLVVGAGHAGIEAALAASLNPYQVLARGYALVTTPRGKICSVDQLQPKDTVCIRSVSHRATCRVETVEEIDESTQEF